MPHLDDSGPEGEGCKTGRKFGTCLKTKTEENTNTFSLGKGMGMRRHASEKGFQGKGRRLRYDQEK